MKTMKTMKTTQTTQDNQDKIEFLAQQLAVIAKGLQNQPNIDTVTITVDVLEEITLKMRQILENQEVMQE